MDVQNQQDIQQRLRCVEGHVRGVATMVGQDRPVWDILHQMDAVEGSLRAIRRMLLEIAMDDYLHNLANAPAETRQHLRSTLVTFLDSSGRDGRNVLSFLSPLEVKNTMAQVKDPVCGMMVDTETAEHKSDYQGTTYYFCAPGCKRAFDKEPQAFLSESSSHGGHEEHGHHGHH